MELPTDIWEMIVKQSREPIEDKVKDLSLIELSKLMEKLRDMKFKKLNDKWDNLPLYTIIADEYGANYMVCKKNSNYKKFILLRKVYYKNEDNYITFFGKFWFCDQTIFRNTAIMNLETNKIVYQTENFIQPNDLDYECFNYLDYTQYGMRNFIKIIQKQEDIYNERIKNANMLIKDAVFSFIEGRLYVMGDCFHADSEFNNRHTAKVIKNTDQSITYEVVISGISKIKRVHKKYVVVSF
jgi:hypothetical protein